MNIKDLGFGVCLGDTLDCNSHYFPLNHTPDWETSWGNKKITKELIKLIKSKGYKTIKVPVTWDEHIIWDKTDRKWTIEGWFISRVKEVVDMILEENMYCIINTHHDENWITDTNANPDYVLDRFESLWRAIAEALKGYSTNLLYESMNEVGFSDNDDLHYRLNQSFCSIIRSVEGNSDRTLIVEGVYADPYNTLLRFRPVTDNNYVIAVHFYTPLPYCINSTSEVFYENADVLESVTRPDIENLQKIRDKYNTDVIMTEFGCARGNKPSDQVLAWYRIIFDYCSKNDIPAIMWNNGKDINDVVSRTDMSELLPGFYDLFYKYTNESNRQ